MEDALRLLPVLLLLVCAPILVMALPTSEAVAVIGPPGSEPERMLMIVASAGGEAVREGGRANVLIARSSQPGFVWRLYGAGAWLVINPLAAGGCEALTEQVSK